MTARIIDGNALAAQVRGETIKWRLNRHRGLLDVVLGRSSVSPEDAVIAHLRVSYDEPERFSSFAATQRTDEPAVDRSRPKRRTSAR